VRTPRDLAQWGVERSLPNVVAASALSVAVLLAGPALVGQPTTHRFLLWNLALAWVPFAAALCIEQCARAGRSGLTAVTGAVFLLFLPNAPYLVSDLTHLRTDSTTPWLDLARLFAFAWAGCVLCAAALRIVHGVVAERLGRAAGWVAVLASAAASGAGVAIGRFARLNSWEVVTQPSAFASETSTLVFSPRAVSVAAFFAALVFVSYLSLLGPSREPH
jgi:uncharacterized membrane protein